MTPVETMTSTQLQMESNRLQSLVGQKRVELNDLEATLGSVRSELARRTRPQPEPRLSDHALLRYIQRIMGVDVMALRSAILTDGVKSAIKAGAKTITHNGVSFRIENNTIVTVVEKPDQSRLKGDGKRPSLVREEAV